MKLTAQHSNISSIRDGLSLFALKAGIASVVIFAGVAGGIYTGLALHRSAGPHPEDFLNSTYIDTGETFPDYELWDVDAAEPRTIADIASSGPTLLLFLTEQCSACHSLLEHWRRTVMVHLRPDIHVVLVYDETAAVTGLQGDHASILPGAVVTVTNRREQKEEDGIVATPTLVAVDRHRAVRFIVTGYDRRVNSDFINKHL